jgi:hypothetical protein
MAAETRELDIPDDVELAYEKLCDEGMTDGLPVIPPTEERVARMIAGCPHAVDHIVAELPPRGGLATIEKIAANAVMAGCHPDYFPVIVTAVEAMAEPQFNLIGIQTTTNPVGPLVLLNGPIRQQIGINCGAGALGPGWRANATIGRALRLILINIGGAIPGEIDKAILGMPGKYSLCLGELEESSPWEPFHVEKGYDLTQSTVTLISSQGTQSCAASYLEPEHIFAMLADTMRIYGANSYTKGSGNPVVIFPPAHARILADAGWTKQRIRETLFERTMFVAADIPPRLLDTSHRQQIRNGMLCICRQPEDIVIIVAGGAELNHIGFLASFGNDMAMRPIPDWRSSK